MQTALIEQSKARQASNAETEEFATKVRELEDRVADQARLLCDLLISVKHDKEKQDAEALLCY